MAEVSTGEPTAPRFAPIDRAEPGRYPGSGGHAVARPLSGFVTALVALAALVALLGAALGPEFSTYDVWSGFIIGPVLLLLVLPAVSRVAAHDPDAGVARFIMAAAFTKIIVGAVARYLMAFELYEEGDSERYFLAGKETSDLLVNGRFDALGELSGTRALEVLTGAVRVVTGPTRLGGFMVFATLAFLGTLLFYRAVVIAFPAADLRRYRWLVFFFPTMVFWPSSIGKDSVMVLCLGAVTYGTARLVTGGFRGLLALGLGGWGIIVVRPHLSLLLIPAAGVALAVSVVFSTRVQRVHRRRFAGALALLVLFLASGFAVAAFQEKFDLEALNPETTEELFVEVNRRTGQGGSSFDAPEVSNPVGMAMAAATVTLRPFPWEAGSAQELATSLEGVVLAGLLLLSVRQLVRIPRLLTREPMVVYAVVYSMGFMMAFVNVENFGILARQRCQFLPFLFILLVIPRAARDRDRFSEATTDGSPHDDLVDLDDLDDLDEHDEHGHSPRHLRSISAAD